MKMTKEEFKTMLMLYVANIDGNIHCEEVGMMLEKSTPEVFHKISKAFAKMNDAEVIQTLNDNRAVYTATAADREELLRDMQQLIHADDRCTAIEEYLLINLKKVLA